MPRRTTPRMSQPGSRVDPTAMHGNLGRRCVSTTAVRRVGSILVLLLACTAHEPPAVLDSFAESPTVLPLPATARPPRPVAHDVPCHDAPPRPDRLCAFVDRESLAETPELRRLLGRRAGHVLVDTATLTSSASFVLRYEWEHMTAAANECVWRLRREKDDAVLLELWPASDCES